MVNKRKGLWNDSPLQTDKIISKWTIKYFSITGISFYEFKLKDRILEKIYFIRLSTKKGAIIASSPLPKIKIKTYLGKTTASIKWTIPFPAFKSLAVTVAIPPFSSVKITLPPFYDAVKVSQSNYKKIGPYC